MQTTFITGVSSGIGQALAESCLRTGQHVYGVSRRKPETLCLHAQFHWRSIDLGDIDRIEEQFSAFFPSVSSIDLVVLNAGVLGPLGDLAQTPLAEIKRVMDVNVWANKALLDFLFSLRIPISQVVAISSGAAVKAGRGWNAYSLSKASLNMLIGLYAAERPDTHFCAFAPGVIDTGMQEQISQLPDLADYASFNRLKAAKGTDAMPTPEEAADVLLHGMEMALEHPSGAFLDIREL
ncbi:MAG: SDR family NAD(P)-dependent oxidoreductase [Verrucomicrobiales bacterium]